MRACDPWFCVAQSPAGLTPSPSSAGDKLWTIMRFCDGDACADCPLADRPDMAPCLRQKALFCMRLAKTRAGWGRDALEELSFEFMAEARAIEQELSVPAAASAAAVGGRFPFQSSAAPVRPGR